MLVWTSTLVSTGLVLGFWTLVLRARLQIGEWPHPRSGAFWSYVDSNSDPKVFTLHHGLVWSLIPAVWYTCPIALVVILVGNVSRPLRQPRPLVAAFSFAILLLALTVALEPVHQCIDWYMD
jgi:hypothetical protein